MDRKEQIVSAAIDRLYTVGFEGFRLGDVAKDVGINNATLIHHYPSKVDLIKAVVEQFTRRFESVAEAPGSEGSPRERLARHMQSSVDLMRTSPEMFVILNDIMTKAHRDKDISHLVSVPLTAWRQHIVALLCSPAHGAAAMAPGRGEEIATACMAQLLGMGLLLNSTDRGGAPFQAVRDRAERLGIVALTRVVEDAL